MNKSKNKRERSKEYSGWILGVMGVYNCRSVLKILI
ncbi:MAG: hypothetical protein Ta2D_08080 [Rickettsiales bacterium]|nr:MAG: hypothetical protein Ta2D_08080 [Rickettsiales bacterium]